MPTTSLGFRYPASTDPADGPTAFNNLASDVDGYLVAHPATTILDRRWVRGSTAHAEDDEFNNASLASAWVRVDASGGTSRATWTEDADSLSLTLNGGDAASEMHGLVRPYALAIGESIQCHIVGHGPGMNYPFAGLVIANGATYGSGTQVTLQFWSPVSTAPNIQDSTWTGYNTRGTSTDHIGATWGTSFHLRIKYSAANTFQCYASPDAVSWLLISTRSATLTPTHIGIAAGSWTAASPFAFAFDYFRVT